MATRTLSNVVARARSEQLGEERRAPVEQEVTTQKSSSTCAPLRRTSAAKPSGSERQRIGRDGWLHAGVRRDERVSAKEAGRA
eukprot:716513-Pleurochrysis_carterae.AAC.2